MVWVSSGWKGTGSFEMYEIDSRASAAMATLRTAGVLYARQLFVALGSNPLNPTIKKADHRAYAALHRRRPILINP